LHRGDRSGGWQQHPVVRASADLAVLLLSIGVRNVRRRSSQSNPSTSARSQRQKSPPGFVREGLTTACSRKVRAAHLAIDEKKILG
jgi:hypothetical protein